MPVAGGVGPYDNFDPAYVQMKRETEFGALDNYGGIGGGVGGVGGGGAVAPIGGAVGGSVGGGLPPIMPGIANVPQPLSEGEQYRQQAADWYRSGLTNEGLLDPSLAYDPTLVDPESLDYLSPYDFDPARSQAFSQLQAQQAGGYQQALTGMASAGGLTAADRMAMASSFNRSRLGAQAGLLGELGVAEGQNVWETEKLNKELRNQIALGNIDLQNQAQMANLDRLLGERRYETDLMRDLYAGEQGEERFDESIAAAEAQAATIEAQAGKSKPGGLLGGSIIPGIL